MAFIHLGPAPTACILLTVPIIAPDGRWTWGVLRRIGTLLAQEYIYTPAECAAAVRTYGVAVSRMIRAWETDRYAITARGKISGQMITRVEWAWDSRAREWTPSEPIDGFHGAAEARARATGIPLAEERFSAASGLPVRLGAPPLVSAA